MAIARDLRDADRGRTLDDSIILSGRDLGVLSLHSRCIANPDRRRPDKWLEVVAEGMPIGWISQLDWEVLRTEVQELKRIGAQIDAEHRAAAPARSGTGPARRYEFAGSSFNVLVVDAERRPRTLLMHALSEHGLQAVGIDDPRRAIKLIGYRPPDLLVIDAMLPGISGSAFLSMVHRHHPTLECPAVLLARVPAVLEQLETGGFSAVLSKPPPMDDLLELLPHPAAAGSLKVS